MRVMREDRLPDVGEVKCCRGRKDVLEILGPWLLEAMQR